MIIFCLNVIFNPNVAKVKFNPQAKKIKANGQTIQLWERMLVGGRYQSHI